TVATSADEGKHSHNGYEIFQFDRDKKLKIDNIVRIIKRAGNHDAVYHTADTDDNWSRGCTRHGAEQPDHYQVSQHGSRANNDTKARKLRTPPPEFQALAEKIQTQHIEKQMSKPDMDKCIGD